MTVEEIEDTFESVKLKQMSLVLAIPCIGVLMSLLIVIAELSYKNSKKYSKCFKNQGSEKRNVSIKIINKITGRLKGRASESARQAGYEKNSK